jgi:predicted dehydrogenase
MSSLTLNAPASTKRPRRKEPAREAITPRERKGLHVPRLGFLGVGWIGRNRLEAIAQSGCARVSAIADASTELAKKVSETCPGAEACKDLNELLTSEIDGVVIATPSALHAEHAIAALEHGKAVFCQKPLARNASETRKVIDAARASDCLLDVDLSYRFIAGMRKIHSLIASGELGKIFAVEVGFHNAYGPDKAWFYDAKLSGGGCVIDLGIHLVDLALWTLDFPKVTAVTSRLFAQGARLDGDSQVEDYAAARMDLDCGTSVQLSCSWKLPAGCDAIIYACFYGTQGGAELRNVNGSFYDFVAHRCIGTRREELMSGSEPWGGNAAVHWAQQLALGNRYNPNVEHLISVAETLDQIYGRKN